MTTREPRSNQLTYRVALPGGQKRLRELIVYISQRCEGDNWFGATKLNKILLYADFFSFLRHGMPVTGEAYQRLEKGPAPKAMKPVMAEMVGQGEVDIHKRDIAGKTQHRIRALREPDLTIFTGRDIALVDEVIRRLWNKTATEVSRFSHGIQWQTRFDLDPIPYEAAYLSDDPVTDADVARTNELAREFGWYAA